MEEIYREHSAGKPYVKNYEAALQTLHAQGAIEAEPKPRQGTFADHISVTFPMR